MRMRTDSVPIAPRLAPYVRSIRLLSNVADGSPYQRLPDGELELQLRRDPHGMPIVNLIGTRLAPLYKRVEASDQVLVLRFRPGGAYPFLGVPMAALTDRVVPLADVWRAGALDLARALGEADDLARFDALGHVLAARLTASPFEPAATLLVRRAVRVLAGLETLPDVTALSARLDVSPRHLRRSFLEMVGLGPKTYLRVLRFQRAHRAVRREPATPLFRIARAAGYYDEAHMAADFRTLSGTTAGALRRARPHPLSSM